MKAIKEDDLLDRVRRSGDVMMAGLNQFQHDFPGLVSKVRGRGTFIAMDLPDVEKRDRFLTTLRRNGVHLGGCGESTVRFRPSLTFSPRHANIMLHNIEKVLKEF